MLSFHLLQVATILQTLWSRNQATKQKRGPKTMNGLHVRPCSFGMRFESSRVFDKLFPIVGCNRYCSCTRTKSSDEMKMNANTTNRHHMRPSLFGMNIKSVWAGVKLSTVKGSYRYCKLRAYRIETRSENGRKTPRKDFMCALTHFGIHFESVRVCDRLSSTVGCNWSYNLPSVRNRGTK